MKRVLIAGADSYIGVSFEQYMQQHHADAYRLDTVDMRDPKWREKSFADYDSVYFVAGIAHRKETPENQDLYYKVNRDLVIETAQKAKADGVKQFVFLSTMSVYGMESGVVTKDTPKNPKNHYGKSKLQAETEIKTLEDDSFRVCILRPPMVYGDGCKGNYQALIKIASVLPILPNFTNRRSMIFVDHLSKCVKEYIDTNASGVFAPQDPQYVCTCEMIQGIRKRMGKRFVVTNLMNPLIALCVRCTTKGRKAFGDLIYSDLGDMNRCE